MISTNPTLANLLGYIEAVLELLYDTNYVPWLHIALLEAPCSLDADLETLYPKVNESGWAFAESSREELQESIDTTISISRFQIAGPIGTFVLSEFERKFREGILDRLDALIDLSTAVIEHVTPATTIPHAGSYFDAISNKALERTVIVAGGDED